LVDAICCSVPDFLALETLNDFLVDGDFESAEAAEA
jgi:hypothetical protein